MGVLVQIRDVPEEVHRTLKARAARQGVSLSQYLRVTLERDAAAPTPRELYERLMAEEPVHTSETSAQALRALRDERS